MYVLIVYNPNAGKRKGPQHAAELEQALVNTAKQFQTDIKVSQFASKSLREMRDFWKTKTSDDFDTVVVIGGDGTVGPIVNELIKNKLDIPLYCYGHGTANDFATFVGTNCRPEDAAQHILQGQTVPADTIHINGHTYAINVACGGAFTNGVTQYNKKSKRIFGKFAYIMQAFFQSFTIKGQKMRFIVDGESFTANVFVFYIVNTGNVGGMRNAAPLAQLSDGKLDLVCIKRCNIFGKISLKLHQSRGTMHKCKHVKYIQGTTFRVEYLPGSTVVQTFRLTDIDGCPAYPYPMDVTVGPKIRVVIPQKS